MGEKHSKEWKQIREIWEKLEVQMTLGQESKILLVI